MAFMNWWTVNYSSSNAATTTPNQNQNQNQNGIDRTVGPTTSVSVGVGLAELALINNAPISTGDVYQICGKYFNNQRAEGNIKPTSVIAVGKVLYAAVQCKRV